MYTSPAFFQSEIGDIDVNTVDGRIHLHHLCLPNHDVIGHAVSDDGLTFAAAEPALAVGNPGECDDDMIWTMHSIRSPQTGLYHMYYTACSLAEHAQVQRVALATSEDFIHWRKHERNPVCVAAPPHYNANMALLGRVAFRDPFIYIENGLWHMLVCASAGAGDRLRRGCVAHAVSKDGFAWKLAPPLYAPAHLDDLEVPALLKNRGRYYLFFHQLRAPDSHYRIAESLDGPWAAPEYDEWLPGNNAVCRFCEWEGKTILYTWYRCEADWPRRTQTYASVVPPKQVNFEPDGTIQLSTFSGWKKYHKGRPATLQPRALVRFAEGPARWQLSGSSAKAEVFGQLVGAARAEFDDFILDVDAQLDEGRALGLIFRGSADLEEANWLRLDFARNRVELHHLAALDTAYHRWMRKQPTLKQTFDAPLERGRRVRLHLVASREYVELSVNDRVCISAATYARKDGRIGVFIENGRGRFGAATVQPIRAPESGG